MSVKRAVLIVLIFLFACGGWWFLGTTTALRTEAFSGRLGGEVQKLWGAPLVQKAPSLSVTIPGSDQVRWVMPSKNTIDVVLNAEHRRKGLIWYPTYTCDFTGVYTITNAEEVAQKVRIHFDFPAPGGTYPNFAMLVDGEAVSSTVNTHEGMDEMIELAPGSSVDFEVTYSTRGIRDWHYEMDPHVGRVQNLNLIVNTNFDNVDFPPGSLSPMTMDETDGGMKLTWESNDLITSENVGVIVPEKLNPGPLTSRITFFAPVCLLFFFVLVSTMGILKDINIHPMHYLFVAAGFFAFHLLLAYLVDHVNIHISFLISAVVSVGLVTGYLTAALRRKLPWKIAIAGQVFFLVLFSYSFFLDGMTGLTVAIGSVVTLAILMKVTAHLDWDTVFKDLRRSPTPPPVPQPKPQPE